jgi:hypothetical protein
LAGAGDPQARAAIRRVLGTGVVIRGLARTAGGPVMSADPGKVEVPGVSDVEGENVFVLRFIPARSPDWVGRPLVARWDADGTWLGQLRPAFGETRFFFVDASA